MKIKKIEKKSGSKCRIIFSNDESFDCSLDIIMKYGLGADDELDNEQLRNIESEQRIYDVKQIAYNYASYKPRTERQVIDKLKKKNFTADEIDIALKFLYEFKMLDDVKFAENFTKELLNRKPVSKIKLITELRKRGIDKDLAENTVESLYPEEKEFDIAMQSAEKKLKTIKNKPPVKQKQAVFIYLQRQGFSFDSIRKVIDDLFGD